MKTITIRLFALIALTIFISFNTASAGNGVKVIELAESGLTIEFPLTPEELAAEKAKRDHLYATRKTAVATSNQYLKTIKMGESGYAVTFKMTAEEIAALNAENARLAAIRSARASRDKKPVVGFELAESGHIIEFPEASTETDLGDSVIASDTADKVGTRVQ